MKRSGISAVLLLLWVTAETAVAAPVVASCHGCGEDRMRRSAEAQVPLSAPAGAYDVYVVNSPARALRRFRVIAEREPGLRLNYARKSTPAQAYRQEFETWVSAWHGVRSASKAAVLLPADFPVRSVTEVFMSRAREQEVSRALNRDLFVVIGGLAGATLQTIGKAVFSAQVFATVEFPDGTRAVFDVTGIDPLDGDLEMLRFEYRKGSARDSENNAVPDRVGAFNNHEGTYRVRANLDRLVQMIRLFDIKMGDRPVLPSTVVCVRTGNERYCWVRRP
jgi:hypothetical protein